MAPQAQTRRSPTMGRRAPHRPARRPLFSLGRTPPRAPAGRIPLKQEVHKKHNCTITFLRDSRKKVHSVIVDIPNRRPVRVTPQEYERWRKIAFEKREQYQGKHPNYASMAAGVVSAHPGVFTKLIGHGKTIGTDAFQAFIDIVMNT